MATAVTTQIATPLSGRRIVVTRPRAQSRGFAETLQRLGAEVVLFPTIKTVPVASYACLDAALDRLNQYQWLLFTSVNGVKYFIERLHTCGKSVEALHSMSIAAIGPETARAVTDLSLRVAAMPDEYRAEALVTALGDVRGQRILLPRAAEAREILPKELRTLGAQVDEIPVYRTIRPTEETASLRTLLLTAKIDMVTFTSSSTVRNFIAAFAEENLLHLLSKTRIGCIGPITANTVREYGLTVTVQSGVYTIPGFTDAIVAYFQKVVSDQ